MTPKPLPSTEILRRLLRYNKRTGALTWRKRPPEAFANKRAAAVWNGRFAGTPALACKMTNGYLHGCVLGHYVLAHRAIWKLVTGEEPVEIDHDNGDRSDNRWKNLADGTRATNMRNRGLSRNNTSGVCGVVWKPATRRWEAFINDGKRLYLGCFTDKESAVAARVRAERRFGFHPAHGRRARHV
jgi:hypothetical protein